VNIQKIPTPRWHEHDGGYYIGTGCMVIMKDPDTGWINYGAYRVQSQGTDVATVMCSKGKHGDLIKRRYHERGEPCPVAVVVGMHPALFMVAGLEIPYGKNEYDVAGGLIGEPVEVIAGPATGLPIPAQAEIAFEGFIHPGDVLEEGPLGEWTGYYAGGKKKEPAIRIETFMHRDDPILLGAIPGMPPDDDSFYRGTYRSGAVWNQLEAAGVPEVKGVWAHAAGGSRLWLTVAIKQQYGGHSKQAGLIASQCHAGAYANRVVVVVDDDIDPADMDQVVWAISTRFEPREGIEILRGCWSTVLDPMAYGSEDPRNARVVIDACKPWSRRDTFPIVARSSKELDARIRAKWAHVLPRG
jgi:4-hydroxy-3-polyprenylbenzoate decarboxylase